MIHWYFNDFLAGMLLMAVAGALFDIARQRQYLFLSWPLAITVLLSASVFWEYVAPLYVEGSVSDPWDIVAYTLGGVF
ncbi:hypothetical protein FLK61_25535 [Paenalkalicoccus suaedae]|uniref:Uncharacterized protein n=1 Tax=Paenalkalicoccus suaedae TaxID=2592382 RepID=A0A859FD40_9BACI|nr:hypothetical protein [Paenalkalicoccus suaedae]QKS70136.1 hypothetical protein FLK61_25535 [Paenalkalicoccus suaedae]